MIASARLRSSCMNSCDKNAMAAARAICKARQAQEVRDKIWALRGQNVASFEAGPLLWLTEYTYTEDTHWLKTLAGLHEVFRRALYRNAQDL